MSIISQIKNKEEEKSSDRGGKCWIWYLIAICDSGAHALSHYDFQRHAVVDSFHCHGCPVSKLLLFLVQGRKNNFPSALLGSWLRFPVIKDRIRGEKQKFTNMSASCIHRRGPGKPSNSPQWPEHHLR